MNPATPGLPLDDELPAFRCHEPLVPPIPLVLDSPHSGEHYPADFDLLPPRSVVRRAEDTHVARLWRGAPARGATLIEALFPRAYIDANRDLADIDAGLLADAWDGPIAPTRKSELCVGLVCRVATGGAPMYGRRLTAAELRRRIERCYLPYHAAVAAALDARHREFGAVWHLDCHSMPAVGDERSDDPGCVRPDFVLGDRDGTSCDRAFTAFVAETLRGQGYEVAINAPFSGAELVRRHGRPVERRHSLQVEVNRALYMDEATLVPTAGYAKLEADLARLVDAVAGFIRARR
jgi:N-formylglutamate deformylase